MSIAKYIRYIIQFLIYIIKNRQLFICYLRDFRKQYILNDFINNDYLIRNFRKFIPAASPSFLLISHELSRTGAPQALLQLGILIKNTLNISPLVISPVDGPLHEVFSENGIDVIIDNRVQDNKFYNDIACLVSIYDYTIVQTVCLPNFIKNYALYSSDCINWIHETYTFFKNRIMAYYNDCDPTTLNFRIWCGSGLSLQISNFFNKPQRIFFYGIDDKYDQAQNQITNKIIFIHVGEIIERKSQLTYINSIKLLPKDIRQKAIFLLIGGSQSDYAKLVLKEIKKIPEIVHYENMPLQDLMNLYKKSHILVSTSTDDPMPTVVSYALMFGMVSIVSDYIGHAKIFNKENGIFSVPNNDEYKFAKLFAYFINNTYLIPLYQEKARKTFLEFFSMEVFKKNFFKLLYEKNEHITTSK